MNADDLLKIDESRDAAGRLRTATVIEIEDGGDVGVVTPGNPPIRTKCDVLLTANSPQLALTLGARVLVLLPAAGESRGCVLGLVATYTVPRPELERPPARVRLAAQLELVLECGKASLTMHEDGRVVIKGTDIVSHARRTQKIRGGTVHIN